MELSDREFKIIMIMLSELMEKINNIYKQMKNFIRLMKIIKKSQQEQQEIKNTVSEMKNPFPRLMSRRTQLRN